MGLEGFTEVDEGERKKKPGAFNTQSVETKFLYSISYFFISIKGERSLNFPFPSSSRLNLENSQFLPSRQILKTWLRCRGSVVACPSLVKMLIEAGRRCYFVLFIRLILQIVYSIPCRNLGVYYLLHLP